MLRRRLTLAQNRKPICVYAFEYGTADSIGNSKLTTNQYAFYELYDGGVHDSVACLHIDSSGDGVRIKNIPIFYNLDFTIDAYMKLDGSIPDYNSWWALCASDTDYSAVAIAYIYYDSSVRLRIYNNTYYNNSGVNINVNQWNHFAITHDSKTHTFSLYVNGLLVDARVKNVSASEQLTVVLSYGNDAFVDNVRVFDSIRYTSNFTPPINPYK